MDLPLPVGERSRDPHAYFVRFRRRLRWRLLVAYVTPLLLLAFYFHFQHTATLTEGIQSYLKSVAENQRNTADLFLQERISNLRSSFQRERVGDPSRHRELEEVLRDLQRESPAFVDLGLLAPEGTSVSYAGPDPSLSGKDYSGESWLRELRRQEQDFFISDVRFGFRQKPHFILAVRRIVKDEPWILRAAVDPEKFGELVHRSHLVGEAEAYLVNSQGERQTTGSRGVPAPAARDLIPGFTSDTSIVDAKIEGERRLHAIAWLRTHRWAVVASLPWHEAFAPLTRSVIFLSAFMAVALALVVLFVNRSTRKLVDRLEAADSAQEQLRRQLFNAAKLASVGEMSSGVAHEINNPLAIIHEEASLLKDLLDPRLGQGFDPSQFRERLDAITSAALRGRTITRNLLAFSREHDPVLELLDLNGIANKVLDIEELQFRVSNIELRREPAPSLPPVLVNSNQMEQVLYNLLRNARDAIGRDGRVTLRTRAVGREVQLDVEDSGCGMTDEQLDKIFLPFYTTKQVGKGTGLGLSISHGIIESFGGRIEVKSKVGEGSTFTVALPAHQGEASEARV